MDRKHRLNKIRRVIAARFLVSSWRKTVYLLGFSSLIVCVVEGRLGSPTCVARLRSRCGFILTLWPLWFWEMFMYLRASAGFAAGFQKVGPQCGDFSGKVGQWGFFVCLAIIFNACRNVRAGASDDEVYAWRFVGISVYCNNEVFVCVLLWRGGDLFTKLVSAESRSLTLHSRTDANRLRLANSLSLSILLHWLTSPSLQLVLVLDYVNSNACISSQQEW